MDGVKLVGTGAALPSSPIRSAYVQNASFLRPWCCRNPLGVRAQPWSASAERAAPTTDWRSQFLSL